jgi:hypothetical protein
LAKGARKLTFTIAPKLMLVDEIAERNLAPRLVKPMLVKRIELPKVSARSAIAGGIEVEYCQVLSLNAQSEGALGEYGRNFKY